MYHPPSRTLIPIYKSFKPYALFLPPFAPFNLFSHISRLHTFYVFVHSLFWPIFAERGQFSKHKYHIFNNLNKTHRNASFVTPFLPFLPPFNTSSEDFFKAFWGGYQPRFKPHSTPLRHPTTLTTHPYDNRYASCSTNPHLDHLHHTSIK